MPVEPMSDRSKLLTNVSGSSAARLFVTSQGIAQPARHRRRPRRLDTTGTTLNN